MTIPRPPLLKLFVFQVALAGFVGIFALLHSTVAAYSALLGGLTYALPNGYFAWKAFKFRGARHANQIVQSFYQAEAWKFVLTALCFGVIFQRVEPLNVLALFVGFITVQASHVLAARIAHL